MLTDRGCAPLSAVRSPADYLATVRKEMNEIRRDPGLSGREKRQMLDELGRVMQQNAAAAIQRRTRPVPTP